ncbi:MAG: hypothetical protein U0R72_12865 [Nakamurella multipartita]
MTISSRTPLPATDQTPADPTPAQSTRVDPASTADSTPLGPRKVGLLAAIAATVIVLDVISKVIVVATIQPNFRPVRVLGGLVYLSLTATRGRPSPWPPG